MQRAGMRRVCPVCASTDVKLDLDKKGGTCVACGKHSPQILEMHFAQIRGYKRDLQQHGQATKFSWKRCEEVHALWLLAMAVVLLLLFIWLATRPYAP